MSNSPKSLVLAIILCLGTLVGCQQTEKTEQPAELNAVVETPQQEGELILPNSLAILPFSNMTETAESANLLRRTLHGHLARTNYEIPHVNHIDNRLALMDPNQGLLPEDAQVIAQMLGVDALLFGNVIEYDRIYAGIYAQISFEVEMMMIDKYGALLWQQTFEEVSREGGISSTPWGILYNMAVTAMHLEDENMFAVADKLGRQIAAKIPQPEGYQHGGTFIESVIHNAPDKTLKYGDVLQVGIKGDANKFASVTLQGINQVFYLKEAEPGVYLGEIPIAYDWQNDGMMLTGYLRSSEGVISKAISPVGLIKVDNIAPQPIRELKMSSSLNNMTISWQHDESHLTYKIYRKNSVGLEFLQQTANKSVTLDHQLSPFESMEITVVAVDEAGNESVGKDTQQVIYPMASLYNAISLVDKRLPAIMDGQLLLRKSDGPFLIDRQVILSAGSHLYIEPGTALEFTSAGNLLVQGSVYTFGGEKVQLRPLNNQLTAQSFLTIDSDEHVQLQGLSIVKAGIAIDTVKGHVLLSECEILDSQYSALVASGRSQVNVQGCLIQGSNTSAIVVTEQAKVVLNECQLKDNFPFHIQSASVLEIEAMNNQWSPEASPMTVLGNVRYE